MYSNLSYSPETPNLGQIRRFLEPCDLEIWRMTLKNNRAPLLCCFQLCAWFHCHMWIQTGVKVRKRLSWVLTSVTLTFDLWPWPFAWTSLLTMVIIPENFMMIRWWEHGEKVWQTDRQTDGHTDGRTDWTSRIAAWSQLKIILEITKLLQFRSNLPRPISASYCFSPASTHFLMIHPVWKERCSTLNHQFHLTSVMPC